MANFRLVALVIFLLQCAACPITGASANNNNNIFQTFFSRCTATTARNISKTHDNDNNSSPLVQVREVLPTKVQNDVDPELNEIHDPKAKRASQSRDWKNFWRRGNDDDDEGNTKLKEAQKSATRGKQHAKEEEHPLRTDLWKLQIQWFRRGGSSSIQSEHQLQMEFHTNGQCRLISVRSGNNGDDPKVWGVGTWISRPYAVSFSVPCKEFSTNNTSNGGSHNKNTKTYIFTAQLHQNPFGKQPKFQQGMILLEKERKKIYECDVLEYDEERDHSFVRPPPKQWFRPVVGKFTGEGIGVDTLDFSYSKRQ